jgi:hypothetical protein
MQAHFSCSCCQKSRGFENRLYVFRASNFSKPEEEFSSFGTFGTLSNVETQECNHAGAQGVLILRKPRLYERRYFRGMSACNPVPPSTKNRSSHSYRNSSLAYAVLLRARNIRLRRTGKITALTAKFASTSSSFAITVASSHSPAHLLATITLSSPCPPRTRVPCLCHSLGR